MNLLQRIALGIKVMTLRPTNPKDNQYFRSLFEHIGIGNALQMPSNMDSYIKNAYEANAVVYSVVSFIAQKAADVPIYVHEWTPEGKGKRIYGHPLENWIYRPNQYFGKSTFFQQYYGFKLITGNSYIYFPVLPAGVNAGKFTEGWVLPSHFMEIISGGWMEPISHYEMMWGDQTIRYEPTTVLHDMFPTYQYGHGQEMYGMSPIQAARRVISKSNSAYESQQKAMENMGVNAIVSADTGVGAMFTQEQAQQMQTAWKEKYGKASMRNTPAFTDANIKVHELGLSPVDLGIIEDQKLTLRDICNIYHVPTEIFNDPDNKTNTNKVESRKAVYTDAVQPLVNSFLDEFNRFIGNTWGEKIYIDADWTTIPELQEDRKLMMEVYSKGVEIGAYNRNQYRQKLGDEAIEGDANMEMYTTTMNVVPLADVTNPSDQLQVDDYPTNEERA
jgi:HK97 family phage portal protein